MWILRIVGVVMLPLIPFLINLRVPTSRFGKDWVVGFTAQHAGCMTQNMLINLSPLGVINKIIAESIDWQTPCSARSASRVATHVFYNRSEMKH